MSHKRVRQLSGALLVLAAAMMSACEDPCVSQCELAAGDCEVISLEAFPNLATTRADWLETAEATGCEARFPLLREGTCADGKRFLTLSGGFVTESRFFLPTGEFVGLSHSTDVVDETCQGNGYWPEPQECDDPLVETVLCGLP